MLGLSCIGKSIIYTSDGQPHSVMNQADFESLLEEYMGSEVVERYHDIEYDKEDIKIASDLDTYESELDGYRDLLLEIRDELEAALGKQRLNRRDIYGVLKKVEQNI